MPAQQHSAPTPSHDDAHQALASIARETVPRWIGRPLAEVEVTACVAEVRRIDSVQHLFQLVEPAVRVSPEVAVAAVPDAGYYLVGRVFQTVDADVGGGVILFLGEHLGVKGDICYLHAVQNLTVLGFTVSNAKLDFGRASAGLVVTF